MIRIKRISDRLIASAERFKQQRSFAQTLAAEGVIVLLQGARGVGKTTALLQYLHVQQVEGIKCLAVSADSVLLDDMRLFDIAESFVAEGGQVLAIDEIHKKEDWEKSLKSIFDSFPELKVIASGSSSLQLDKADLSRRAIKVNCYGLSFREWLNIRFDLSLKPSGLKGILHDHPALCHEILGQLRPAKISIVEAFKTYLQVGYFPTSFGLDLWVYLETLGESVRKTVEQDILACYPELSGKSIQRIKKALSIMAAKCPYVPDINDLTAALDLADQKTTKQYLYYLHEARLIREVAKVGKTVAALSKAEKIYLDNTNYLYALSRQEPDKGTIRETFMANMLGVHCEMHKVEAIKVPKNGDFIMADGEVFEVGGKRKGFSQIAGEKNGWVVVDDLDYGENRKIPLWLFGFLW